MAVAIDARVLSGLNKYEEVNRDSQKHVRNFAFTKQTFRPNFSAKTMDPKLRNLNLKRIVGTTEASWFSPNAANTATPFADILACREVAPRIFRLETAWLSRLFTPLLAVRPTGTSDWFVVVGDICAVLVKGWPLAVDSGIYTPITNNDSVAKNFVCHDIDAFEAFPLKPACPMHRACLVEVAAHGYFFGKVVRLKASGEYGALPIGAVAAGPPRPLLDTSCRGGFGSLPPSFLQKLEEYLQCDKTGTSLFDILTSLAPKCVKDLTDEIMKEIYDARRVSFEFDEDLLDLVELEYVLDCFDGGDRLALETEIKDARDKKDQRQKFDESVCAWKVYILIP